MLDVVEAVPVLDPENVLIADLTLERELLGDFIREHAALEDIHDEALQLFIDGDEAGGDLGDAVADAARAVLLIEEGYERWAQLELVVPFDAEDDLGVSTGTDAVRSLAEQGIDLVQEGQARLEAAYLRLLPLEFTSAQEARLEAAAAKARDYQATGEPALRHYAGDVTTQEILEVDRFEGTTGTAKARWVTYVCIPRGSANALSPEALAAALANSLTFVADDCPNFPDPELLDPAEAEAANDSQRADNG